MRALVPEIAFAKAQSDAGPLTELSKSTLRVRAPLSAENRDADYKALLETKPTGRDGYIARGGAFLDGGRYADALKDFDKAVDLDPGSTEAIACRGLAHAWLGHAAAAKADFDRAADLDPTNIIVWRGRGLRAERDGEHPEAIAAYSRALELAPGDLFALQHRATVLAATKAYPQALADLDAAAGAGGDADTIHAAKARIYGLSGDLARLRTEAALVRFQGRDDEGRRISLLDLLWTTGHKEEARAEVRRMLSVAPTAELYLRRSSYRDRADLAGMESDARAALALDPKSYAAAATLANIRFLAHDLTAARTYAERAAANAPNEAYAQLSIAPVVAKAGGAAARAQVLARTRALIADDATALNTLCYSLAVTGVELEGALADCDRSLKLRPGEAAVLDSRAFVLLRMGRDKEALSAYDAALTAAPTLADSLYGRSLAERRLGDAADADRDLKSALAQNPEVAKTFERYGVTR